MQVIGKITLADLGQMQRKGLSPEKAAEMCMAEAKARYPRAEAVAIIKGIT